MIKSNRRYYSRKSLILVLSCHLLFLCCLFSTPASSQMFSMWRDAGMNYCDVFTEPYTAFDIYVFIEPPEEGVIAVEYKLQGPLGHFMYAGESAAIVSGATVGTPYGSPGISADLLSCQTESVWIWKVTCMSPNITPGYYRLFPHDDTGFRGVTICTGDQPRIETNFIGEYGFNSYGFCFNVATEESSWGAIKALYR